RKSSRTMRQASGRCSSTQSKVCEWSNQPCRKRTVGAPLRLRSRTWTATAWERTVKDSKDGGTRVSGPRLILFRGRREPPVSGARRGRTRAPEVLQGMGRGGLHLGAGEHQRELPRLVLGGAA